MPLNLNALSDENLSPSPAAPKATARAAPTVAAPAAPAPATQQPPPPPPSLILDPNTNTWYKLGALLGKGGFAMCYSVTDTATGRPYACKYVHKSTLTKRATERKLRSEIAIHEGLRHRHVVPFLRWFETSEAIYMILGLCENGTLMDMLRARKRLTEPEVQVFGLQFISALAYLHDECRVIHRDLKLGNVFLTKNMDIVLGDFGLAAVLEKDEDRRKTVCGTPNYIAPEVLDATDGHGFEVDVWSFGVVLYTLLVGKPPFETTTMKSTYKKIKAVSFSFPSEPIVSEAARSLICWILNRQPEARPTLEQIRRHHFFSHPVPHSRVPETALATVPVFPAPVLVSSSSSSSSSASTGSSSGGAVLVGLEQRMSRMAVSGAGGSASTPQQLQQPQATTSAAATSSRGHDEVQTLQDLAQRLTRALAQQMTQQPPPGSSGSTLTNTGDAAPPRPPRGSMNGLVKVHAFVDLRHMWGFGYILSNGMMGINYNDQTMLVWPLQGKYFRYVERGEISRHAHAEGGYPERLAKKVRLIHEFWTALTKECRGPLPAPTAEVAAGASGPLHFVKKALKQKHADLFLLGGGATHVKFYDGSELAFAPAGTDSVLYVSKTGESELLTLDQAVAERRKDVMQRVGYMNDCVKQILAAKRTPSASSADVPTAGSRTPGATPLPLPSSAMA